jgi:hypothetical protein
MFEPSAKQIVELLGGLTHEDLLEVVSVPTLLVPWTWIEAYTQDKPPLTQAVQDKPPLTQAVQDEPPLAQAVLDWLLDKGLLGDRTRKNLHGYPELFRDLLNPPPWVEVQLEDCEGQLTPERAGQLSPAYLQLVSGSDAGTKFKHYCRQNGICCLGSHES